MKTPDMPAVLQQFANRAVLISGPHFQSFVCRVRDRAEMAQTILEKSAQGRDDKGEPCDLEKWYKEFLPDNRVKYGVKNGVATVPVQGVISRGTSKVERLFYGMCDVDLVAEDMASAEQDPECRVIKLAVNSPGGSGSQVPEVARLIANSSKPVITCIDELCGSAAEWLSAGSTEVWATESAEIGSIGVYIAFIDYSRWLEDEGIRVDIVKAGRLKATGFPGTALSEEQRAYLQEGVDEFYNTFTGFIREHRGSIAEDHMQGQTFSADNAKKFGLVDKVFPDCRSMEKALEAVAKQEM